MLEEGIESGAVVKQTATSEKRAARDALIEEYQHFVEALVSRLIRTMGLPQRFRDDFIGAGFLGLVEAAGRFEAGRGKDFRAFAFLRIRGAVIDHIRASCDLSGRAYQTLKALEVANEVRESAGVYNEISEGDRMKRALRGIDVLSKSATAFKVLSKQDGHHFLGRGSVATPEDALSKKQLLEKIRHLLATLPEKERTIIEQYYFNDRKLSEVAEQYAGLSKSWVSRLHERALGILRDKMVEEGLRETK